MCWGYQLPSIHLLPLDSGVSFSGILMEEAGHKWRHDSLCKCQNSKDGSSNLWVYERYMSKKDLLMDSEGDYNIK